MLLFSTRNLAALTVVQVRESPVFREFLEGFQEEWRMLRMAEPGVREIVDEEGILVLGSRSWRWLQERKVRLQGPVVLACVVERLSEGPRQQVLLRIAEQEWARVIRKAFPWARRVLVVRQPGAQGPEGEAFKPLVLERVEARSAREVLRRMGAWLARADVFWLYPDSLWSDVRLVDRVLERALRYGVPVLAPSRFYLERGAVLSVEPDYRVLGRETARWWRKGRPENAVPRVNALQVAVNRTAARVLRISIPRELQ